MPVEYDTLILFAPIISNSGAISPMGKLRFKANYSINNILPTVI